MSTSTNDSPIITLHTESLENNAKDVCCRRQLSGLLAHDQVEDITVLSVLPHALDGALFAVVREHDSLLRIA